MERHHVVHDGLRHQVLDWGGAAEAVPLVLLHPNGFCAGAFGPLASRLVETGRFRVLAVDLRGHGGTDKPRRAEAYGYGLMAADVVAVLDALGIGHCVLLGNSLGGGVAVLVDQLAPGMVRHLLLCEAICTDPVFDRAGRPEALAEITRKRRVVWPSRKAMLEAWRHREPFSAMALEMLEAYIEHGVCERDDGQVELACPPEVEAWIYAERDGPAEAFAHLGRQSASVSVLAGTTTSIPHEIFRQQGRRAGVPVTWVEGGHFFLQEDTGRAVELVLSRTAG